MSEGLGAQISEDDAPYRIVLRRVGTAFILYGLLDIGMMAYCIWQGQSYSSSFNVFAVIAGLLIRRGSLRVARWAAWFNAFFAGATLIVFPLMIYMVPFDFVAAAFRFAPTNALVFTLYPLISICFLVWTQWRLSTAPVKDAYPGRPPRQFWKSVLAGIGGAVGVAVVAIVLVLFNSVAAKDAIRQARAEAGPEYSCFLTNLHVYGPGYYSGEVIVWNDDEMRRVSVSGVVGD